MTYSTDAVDLAAAERILAQFWPETMSVQGEPSVRFRWYYLDNPDGRGIVFLLTHRNSNGETEVVGSAGAGPRTFAMLGRMFRAAQLVDFATAKPHRTGFPALLLQRTARAHCKREFNLLFGFPNNLSAPIFLRLGYRQLGKMARLVRVLRYEPYLRSRLLRRTLAALPGALLDAASSAVETLRARRASAGMTLETVQDVDARFDELWEAAHGNYSVVGYRGSDFLRWRFLARPTQEYRIFTLVPKGGRELRAYGVIEGVEGEARLADLFGRTERDVSLLLDLLIPEMRRWGFRALSFHVLGPEWIWKMLKQHGFQIRYSDEPVFVEPGDAFPVEDSILANPQAWYLTSGDRDT